MNLRFVSVGTGNKLLYLSILFGRPNYKYYTKYYLMDRFWYTNVETSYWIEFLMKDYDKFLRVI